MVCRDGFPQRRHTWFLLAMGSSLLGRVTYRLVYPERPSTDVMSAKMRGVQWLIRERLAKRFNTSRD